jgi:opacity protein-like surface antigen
MRPGRLVAVVTSTLALGTTAIMPSASAQSTSAAAAGVQFGIAGGLSQPTGDVAEGTKSGFNITGMLGFNPATLPFGLRLDLGWNQFAFDEDELGSDPNFPPGADPGGRVRILGGALNAILKLPATSVSPYLVAGPGVYNVDFSFDDDEIQSGLEEFGIELSQTKFALQGGVGLQFNLAGMSSHLEAKFVNIFVDEEEGIAEDVRFIPITFGIMFGGGGTASGSRVRTR